VMVHFDAIDYWSNKVACILIWAFSVGPFSVLTFKNRASYIQDGRTATLQMFHFIYFFSTPISTEYFKHAAHSPFFSSKCRLFHNATFFWFMYYSHFTYRMC
jgi:hypothetical protein